MTSVRLLLRNLLYHWRGNLAVLLGVALGTAVLTGALLVGDSLRGSLRDRADRQLFGTEHALVGGRFFREQLAAELPGGVRPVILLRGTVTAGDRRVGARKAGLDPPYGKPIPLFTRPASGCRPPSPAGAGTGGPAPRCGSRLRG